MTFHTAFNFETLKIKPQSSLQSFFSPVLRISIFPPSLPPRNPTLLPPLRYASLDTFHPPFPLPIHTHFLKFISSSLPPSSLRPSLSPHTSSDNSCPFLIPSISFPSFHVFTFPLLLFLLSPFPQHLYASSLPPFTPSYTALIPYPPSFSPPHPPSTTTRSVSYRNQSSGSLLCSA